MTAANCDIRVTGPMTNTRVEPMIPPAKDGGNKRRVNVPEVVNGIMYIFEHGCQ